MFFKIVQKWQFLQDIVINILTGVHPAILHNVGKIEIIKKSFHQITTEQIEGSYFEFGVFEGSSLLAAAKIHHNMGTSKWKKFYLKAFDRKFFGFDSFDDGFRYFDKKDIHPFFREGDFVSSYDKCQKRLKCFSKIKLIRGYFEETVKDKNPHDVVGNEKCAVLFVDCDLSEPAFIALDFMAPLLQKGSIIIIDDYFAYLGDIHKGCYAAFTRFLDKHKRIKVREFMRYGYNGASFIVYDVCNGSLT